MGRAKIESSAPTAPAQAVYDEQCRLPAGARDVTLGIFAFFLWVQVVNMIEQVYAIGFEEGRSSR